MNESLDHIHQLVLEEIAGLISPEDLSFLDRMTERDAAVKAKRQEMHAVFNETVKAELAEIGKKITLPHIIALHRKEKRKRNRNRGMAIVGAIVLAAVTGIMYLRSIGH